MPLRLRMLGPPELTAASEKVELPPPWALLLLGFVASQDQGVSRSDVVATFWPEEDERKARHNLSQLLYRYRGVQWLSGLEVSPSRLRWTGECDVQAFREAVITGDWQTAVRLYRGELLAGVQADRSVHVATWLESERSELLGAWREATLAYADRLSEEGRYGDAADAIKRVLSQEILAEDLLQAYMNSSRLAGRRAQGLELFERFRWRLHDELGIEPLPATQRLAQQLREPAEDEAPPLPTPEQSLLPTSKQTSLPGQRTPFIGRDIELAELASTFSNPTWRLLTITGPGGVGKSRTAVQVASEQQERFRDGVVFVPLAPLSSHEYLASAISAALGLDNRAEEAEQRLSAYLSNKQMLLVVDNFEHLLEGAPLVISLLEAAPELRIVATSREPLGLQQERCYELKGLSYPAEGDDEFAQVYDAVQLFLSTARRMDSRFVLDQAEMPAVVRICRLLAGIPLGLELAGSWVRLLSVDELARSLEGDFDLLESQQADRPARHHSLRAVFENSWRLLPEQERETLARLAVFRGGFDRDSAQAVSQAALKTLLALANKSLLGRTRRGRFELLEPVRQYAQEKLAVKAGELEAARRRHAHYFAALAQRAESGMQGRNQTEWMERLELERDNLRSALEWAAESGEAELGLRTATSLQQFWWVRGPYREGWRTLQRFLDLPLPDVAYPEDATEDESSRRAELQALRGKALHRAGTLLQEEGDFERARAHYRQALELAREWEHEQLAADALHSLGLLETKRGENTAAFAFYEESAGLQRQLGDTWGLSVTLNNMGVTLMQQGKYDAATPPLNESLELKRELGEAQGVAYALHNLGMAHYWSGDLERARSYNEESLKLKQRVGDEQGMATSIANRGRLALDAGEYEEASKHFAESTRRLAQLNNQWTLLWVLTAVVRLKACAGLPERALRLAGVVSSLARRLGVSLPAPNEQEMAAGIEAARDALGRDRAQRLLLEGQGMQLEEALSLVGAPVASRRASD